ncbi:MAG: hypothetical protein NVS4B3_16320 [Gemmatimonadaceae bacterium]
MSALIAGSLRGARVALLEARFEGEMAALVRRFGGEPLSAPAVREATLEGDSDVAAFLDRIVAGQIHAVIVLTGVGCRLLFAAADRLGRVMELRAGLATTTIIARGPKPGAALRAQGLRAAIDTPSPYTIADLVGALRPSTCEGRSVTVIAYGERSEELDAALRARGAISDTLQLYEWQLPDDVAPLRSLVSELLTGSVDAVAFTSQVQARHLFAVASDMNARDALRTAMRSTTVVVSIGPTCTAVLEALGIPPQVTAHPPKMRPMLTALADYLARHSLPRAAYMPTTLSTVTLQ